MAAVDNESAVGTGPASVLTSDPEDRGEGPSHRVVSAGSSRRSSATPGSPVEHDSSAGSEEARLAQNTTSRERLPASEPERVHPDGAAPQSDQPAETLAADDRPPSPAMRPADAEVAAVQPAATAPTSAPASSAHLDLATFPTPDLLKLLASLLQQIAHANDALRPDSSTMTADEATGVSVSAQTQTRSSRPSASATPARSASGSSTTSSRRAFSAESLVIPPFKPKNTAPPPAAAAERPRSPDRAPRESVSSPMSTSPPAISRQSSQAPQPPPHRSNSSAPPVYPSIFTASRQSINHPSSILCFHARNIPSISIEAYLQRILKYCPITNEVFLSLLVYFDRMSRQHVGNGVVGTSYAPSQVPAEERTRRDSTEGGNTKGFAIDSYNVHRLVIAGITVASKFFSDVFYTNSRYAKVGGLPQSELNQLELQFLLLNDFRLVIPLEEMQRYADQLLLYWETKQKGRAAEPPREGEPPQAKQTTSAEASS